MIVHMCKKCGQFTLLGYKNAYGEYFCDQECYRKYCEINNYSYVPSSLTQITSCPSD